MYPFEAENYILWKKNSPSFAEKNSCYLQEYDVQKVSVKIFIVKN